MPLQNSNVQPYIFGSGDIPVPSVEIGQRLNLSVPFSPNISLPSTTSTSTSTPVETPRPPSQSESRQASRASYESEQGRVDNINEGLLNMNLTSPRPSSSRSPSRASWHTPIDMAELRATLSVSPSRRVPGTLARSRSPTPYTNKGNSGTGVGRGRRGDSTLQPEPAPGPSIPRQSPSSGNSHTSGHTAMDMAGLRAALTAPPCRAAPKTPPGNRSPLFHPPSVSSARYSSGREVLD